MLALKMAEIESRIGSKVYLSRAWFSFLSRAMVFLLTVLYILPRTLSILDSMCSKVNGPVNWNQEVQLVGSDGY